jgi:hypothetical protein
MQSVQQVVMVPLLVGVVLGAPLIAREIETGTDGLVCSAF